MCRDPNCGRHRRTARGLKAVRDALLMVGIGSALLAVVEIFLQAGFYVREVTMAKSAQSSPASLPDYEGWGDAFFEEEQAANKVRWNSYTYWRREPHAGKYVSVDQNGLRKTISTGTTGDAKRVFFFGGSTMWGTGSRDAFTIPSQVVTQMRERQVSMEATNFGEMGYVSTQGVIELMLQLRSGNVPRAVVFYDGVNDTLSAFQSGTAGRTLNEHNRVREFNLTHSRRRGDLLAAAIQSSVNGLSIARIAKGAMNSLGAGSDALTEDQREQLAEETAAAYVNNMRIVGSLAETYDFEVFCYLQPWIFHKDPLTEHATRTLAHQAKFGPLVEAVYRKVDQRIGDVSPHVHFRDISGALEDETSSVFIDLCHLSERGNRMIASEMVDDLSVWMNEVQAEFDVSRL